MSNLSDEQIHFRVALIGSHRQRVAKVWSLIADQSPIEDHDNEPKKRQIHVEYIPCVATFDSYENEQGESVKYLVKLEYHGVNGQSRGASLAPFFDEVMEEKDPNVVRLPGISGISLGCGIESEEEIDMISTFINSISGRSNENAGDGDDEMFIMKCIKPNLEYSSMKEETLAYRSLPVEEKETVTKSHSMGPAKMAKFTMELARECIPQSKLAIEKALQIEAEASAAAAATNVENEAEEKTEEPLPLPMPEDYDPNTIRYACKMCRTILFSEAELEDPPHTQSQHKFTSRKTKSGGNVNSAKNQCQSLFLADSLNWMGDISMHNEGKFSCPKCSGKLGLYKWHGTQCSCGTWVVPAIMIHKSRVDVVPPRNEMASNQEDILARLHVGGYR